MLVVVGASLAGLRAVEAARKQGFSGRVVLVGAETHPPYDRPPLSKAFLATGAEPAAPSYRDAAALAELDVELRLGSPATGLDLDAREVQTADGTVPYDALVVATGASPRTLPGPALTGVHVLRTLDDARAVRAGLDAGARTVVVGAGFIGSEVASAARERGLPVTVLEAAPAPALRAVGPVAAALCAGLHERAGVDLRCGATVAGLEGDGARVTGVRLSTGEALPADLVVVGIGCTPATSWLEASGLVLDDGVRCDERLMSCAAGVFAAGDVARVDTAAGPVRLEHWTSAAEQGALAGANAAAHLVDQPLAPWAGVPYFWSDAYGSKLQLVGHPTDQAEVLGDADGPWLVLYRRGDLLAGALSLDLPGRIMKFRALVQRGAPYDDALALARSRPLVAA